MVSRGSSSVAFRMADSHLVVGCPLTGWSKVNGRLQIHVRGTDKQLLQ
jgi:hypothetical protein